MRVGWKPHGVIVSLLSRAASTQSVSGELRSHNSSNANNASHANSEGDNPKDRVGVSTPRHPPRPPLPYRSTHKGSGDASVLRKPKPQIPSDTLTQNLSPGRSSCAEDGGVVPARPLSPLQRRQLMFRHKAAFRLTPHALRRVRHLLAQHNATEAERPDGIRIGVRRRGCSGYSYTVNYHFSHSAASAGDGTASSDVVVEQEGVKVVVDRDALFYVIGTEMDYVVRNVEEKFTFRNPNQKFSCGCEESFMPFDVDEQE